MSINVKQKFICFNGKDNNLKSEVNPFKNKNEKCKKEFEVLKVKL
jgi:hypothetical protein